MSLQLKKDSVPCFLSALLSFTQSFWKVFKPQTAFSMQFGMVLKLFRRRKMS